MNTTRKPTIPHRVRDRQLKQLHNVLDKLEEAVVSKGPDGEKSCSGELKKSHFQENISIAQY